MKIGDKVVIVGPISDLHSTVVHDFWKNGPSAKIGASFVITEMPQGQYSAEGMPMFPESSLRLYKDHYIQLFKKHYEMANK